MNDKLSSENFCTKLESEGIYYAFLEYGLSHRDLNQEEDPDFYNLVKRITEKFENLSEDLNELDKYMNKYFEEM